jgi:hypothetical protein
VKGLAADGTVESVELVVAPINKQPSRDGVRLLELNVVEAVSTALAVAASMNIPTSAPAAISWMTMPQNV